MVRDPEGLGAADCAGNELISEIGPPLPDRIQRERGFGRELNAGPKARISHEELRKVGGEAQQPLERSRQLVPHVLGERFDLLPLIVKKLLSDCPYGITTIYAGSQEIAISVTGMVTATRYYSFSSQTVAMRTGRGLGNAVTSLVNDHHGTPIGAISNGAHPRTSDVTRLYTTPFGGVRGSSHANTVPGDKQFLGKTRDESTGLTQIGARYYDELVGSFISVDPLLDLTDPQQWNGYAYAHNNPVSFADPTGLLPRDPSGHQTVADRADRATRISMPVEVAPPGCMAPSAGACDAAEEITATEREANETVWELFGLFVTGLGRPDGHYRFDGTDAYAKRFMLGETAGLMRERIEEWLRQGKSAEAGSVEVTPEMFVRDAIVIASNGHGGNLPEAFTGSFNYEFQVVEQSVERAAIVQITVTNPTTIESFTRIPWDRENFFEYFKGPMDMSNQLFGTYKRIDQTLTWTERVHY
ncbi:RHS repeat-associated core domain-containing protein [Agromyces silvae]|uniref:RHS repeat-associated core domain-containing protein n=1 Tax=Agromyces silvae TaxID=3388266 RepID=UPI00280C2248|nr:RHS repeat-associated core domain-containing protein [Agromyces protaetiae]